MRTEITKFTRWLRCKKPLTSTHIHYASDLRLFFAWVTESLITLRGLISLKESV